VRVLRRGADIGMDEALLSSLGRAKARKVSSSTGNRHQLVMVDAVMNSTTALLESGRHHAEPSEDSMKYGFAWLLGIPIPILVVVYLVYHC
jgi:hypothetical protein